MHRREGWRLSKWYADCVTPEGAVVIGYVAVAAFGRLRIRYAATLELDAAGARLRQRQSLRGGSATVASCAVSLAMPALGASGTWSGGRPSEPASVASTPEGEVRWQALALDASARVRCGRRTYSGAGYAEVVHLTLPPWRLPFATLRWGRFVADDRSAALTWIVTDGSAGVSRAWSPGRPEGFAATADDGGVSAGGLRLTLAPGVGVRHERVARTLLGVLEPTVRLLPRALRGVEEHKRLSRGVLLQGGTATEGWSIHERVVWP